MIKTFKTSIIISASIYILLLVIFIPSLALADGGMFFYDLYDEAHILNETDQISYINYANGIQKMIIAANAKSIKQAKSIIWLFPLPSSPENIKIDIINKLPNFNGGLLKGHFLKYYNELVDFLLYTQYFRFIIYYLNKSFIELGNHGYNDNNITMFQRVEKLGLTAEIISAKNSDSLENYLTHKKLAIPKEFKTILNYYINKDYSFVISYISNLEKFSTIDHQLGIYVTFPTNKMFFPLKPTSIYGNTIIPIKIFALNYVEPELGKLSIDIKSRYHFNNNIEFGDEFNDFFFNKNINNKLRYTMIEIRSHADRFINDLWINPSGPKPYIFQFLIDYYYLSCLLIWLLLSCISSLLAADIAFNDTQFNKKMFFTFGTFNLLSLLAMIVMAFKLRIDIKYTNIKPIEKNFPFKKFIITTLLLSFCFLFLTHQAVQSFETIFRDMGDAKLPFFINLMLNKVAIFYFIISIVLLQFWGIITFLFCKNPRLASYITTFTIIFHFLIGLLSYTINNVY